MHNSSFLQESLSEIDCALREDACSIAPQKAAERAHFMKAKMPMLGLRVPEQRARLKKGYSFSQLSFEEQLPIWTYVWKAAQTHEAKMQAAFFVEKPPKSADLIGLWEEIAPWARSINCWDQSDTLSNIYAFIHERHGDVVGPCLARWNDSDNPWERRQSLVALLYYSRLRQHFPDPDFVFEMIERRLADPDYYVQKGVGWTLREAYHVWPERVLDFLSDHVVALAPAAWQAATEKLGKSVKQELKLKRKARSSAS